METIEKRELQISCPHCRKRVPWEGNSFRPFCSERCRMIDLGRWADEEYRVAGEKAVSENDNLIPFPGTEISSDKES